MQLSIAYPQTLKKIIQYGQKEKNFNIDEPNEFGKTPLMWAAQYGFLESVKILLDSGANINKQTYESNCDDDWDSFDCIRNGKRTALMYAVQEGQGQIVRYLLDQKADKTLKDSLGKTAYDYLLGNAPDWGPYSDITINGGLTYKREKGFSSFV